MLLATGTTATTPRFVADALSFAALLLTMTAGRSKAASAPIGVLKSTIHMSPRRAATAGVTVSDHHGMIGPTSCRPLHPILPTPKRSRRQAPTYATGEVQFE